MRRVLAALAETRPDRPPACAGTRASSPTDAGHGSTIQPSAMLCWVRPTSTTCGTRCAHTPGRCSSCAPEHSHLADEAAERLQALPNVELVVVPNATHNVMTDNPVVLSAKSDTSSIQRSSPSPVPRQYNFVCLATAAMRVSKERSYGLSARMRFSPRSLCGAQTVHNARAFAECDPLPRLPPACLSRSPRTSTNAAPDPHEHTTNVASPTQYPGSPRRRAT